MSELLNFILDHEEAFKSSARLASLYSDFSYQAKTNPEGYAANISAWRQALGRALRAGKVPSPGVRRGDARPAGNDTLVLETGEELSRALNTRTWGRPVALGNVIQDCIEKRQLIPVDEFLTARTSIYSRSWLPSPWQVVAWGLQRLGLVNEKTGEGTKVGRFVVMDNIEAAAQSLLSSLSHSSDAQTSQIHSLRTFAHTYSHLFGLSNAPLSANDIPLLLTYLSRDKPTLSYSPATGTINLSSPYHAITENDTSIANVKTLLLTLSTQIPNLEARVSTLDGKARAAVSAKQRSAALAALRSKKLVTETLDKRRSSVLQLEEILAEIDRAHDNLAMVRAMEASASVLRNLNREIGGVERVERITERLRTEMDKVEDFDALMGEVGGGVVVDEGEVDDELEELERVEMERKTKEEAEDRRKEAEAKEDERRAEEDERRAEEMRKRLFELEDLDKKRREAEKEIGSKKSSDDQEVEESTEKMGRISLEDNRAVAKSQSDNDQSQKEEAKVLAS